MHICLKFSVLADCPSHVAEKACKYLDADLDKRHVWYSNIYRDLRMTWKMAFHSLLLSFGSKVEANGQAPRCLLDDELSSTLYMADMDLEDLLS